MEVTIHTLTINQIHKRCIKMITFRVAIHTDRNKCKDSSSIHTHHDEGIE